MPEATEKKTYKENNVECAGLGNAAGPSGVRVAHTSVPLTPVIRNLPSPMRAHAMTLPACAGSRRSPARLLGGHRTIFLYDSILGFLVPFERHRISFS